MKNFLFVVFIIFISNGCNSNPQGSQNKTVPVDTLVVKQEAERTPEIKQDSLLNSYALFLAGMKDKNPKGIPTKLLANSFYKVYARDMDSNFAIIEEHRFKQMREWAKTELKTELNSPGVLFYPFSGPDILHAITFYPNAKEYIMIAMERYGDFPNIQKMDSAQAAYYLHSVTESLQDIFKKSYFITRKMVQELQKVKVNGVTPLICLFLVRTNHTVVAIKKEHLNDNGTISELHADSLPSHYNDFIEIYFRDNGSENLRKIIYFRANVGDDMFAGLPSFKKDTALQNYLNRLPEVYTYTKSASYLMNYPSFSLIRNICLNKSKSILQDDTGIGFKYFDQKKWRIKLYGRYARPVSDFKWVYDNELEAAYKKDSMNVKPLNFSLGYHWGHQQNQNLIKAEKL